MCRGDVNKGAVATWRRTAGSDRSITHACSHSSCVVAPTRKGNQHLPRHLGRLGAAGSVRSAAGAAAGGSWGRNRCRRWGWQRREYDVRPEFHFVIRTRHGVSCACA
jgi:hypothetical protein